MDLQKVVEAIMDRPGPMRLVAIDGPGGAGKSTFAHQLAAAAGGAPVVHTDDFASPAEPIDWWPRLLEQVIDPLRRGERSRFQRFDWASRSLAEWITIEPVPIVIIEGVTSGRGEWAAHLSFLIWVETPEPLRISRVVARDGSEALEDWGAGSAAEQRHYARDETRSRADVEVDGST